MGSNGHAWAWCSGGKERYVNEGDAQVRKAGGARDRDGERASMLVLVLILATALGAALESTCMSLASVPVH